MAAVLSAEIINASKLQEEQKHLPVDVPVTGSGGQRCGQCSAIFIWWAAETNWWKNVSQSPCVSDLQSLDVCCNTFCGEVDAG